MYLNDKLFVFGRGLKHCLGNLYKKKVLANVSCGLICEKKIQKCIMSYPCLLHFKIVKKKHLNKIVTIYISMTMYISSYYYF